ncbi:acyl carrier protein [Streptomyces polygonati]|uniref:Acyl carrier protein n=1 Tax=Streptomyces polygonati TaxID=1617087 RepID=A0ABV8HJT3_9ACTN
MNVVPTIKTMLASELMVEIPLEQMRMDDSLRDAFGLDSLGFVELRVLCEQAFDVVISDDDFSPENFSTLGEVVGLVERLIKEQENTNAQPTG